MDININWDCRADYIRKQLLLENNGQNLVKGQNQFKNISLQASWQVFWNIICLLFWIFINIYYAILFSDITTGKYAAWQSQEERGRGHLPKRDKKWFLSPTSCVSQYMFIWSWWLPRPNSSNIMCFLNMIMMIGKTKQRISWPKASLVIVFSSVWYKFIVQNCRFVNNK